LVDAGVTLPQDTRLLTRVNITPEPGWELTTKTQRHKENREAKHEVSLPSELGIVKCAPVIDENIMRIGF
jgi:hypothetical protein